MSWRFSAWRPRRVRRDRTPQLVTVYGHAGVGKSRLVGEFARTLEDARVLVGRCVPYGDGITYLPLIEVASAWPGSSTTTLTTSRPRSYGLPSRRPWRRSTCHRSWVGWRGRSASRSRIARAASRVARTFGGRSTRPGRTTWPRSDETARPAGHRGHPLGVRAILDLVDHVFGALENCAALIVCPARPELVRRAASLGRRAHPASSLVLTPLGGWSRRRSCEHLLDAETVSEGVARSILEPADGNPFFVEEMLSMLVEQGALERREGVWTATARLDLTGVPDSIQGIIAARIDLLDAESVKRCAGAR